MLARFELVFTFFHSMGVAVKVSALNEEKTQLVSSPSAPAPSSADIAAMEVELPTKAAPPKRKAKGLWHAVKQSFESTRLEELRQDWKKKPSRPSESAAIPAAIPAATSQ